MKAKGERHLHPTGGSPNTEDKKIKLVSFFDGLKLPGDDVPDDEDFETPEWWSVPRGWLGGVVALQLLVARSDLAAVYLSGFVAYPTGFVLTVNTLTASTQAQAIASDPYALGRTAEGGELPAELLRFGVRYSDGRKQTTIGEWVDGTSFAFGTGDDEEDRPDPSTDLLITPGGGGGGDRDSHQDYWIWPLPPPGAVTFVCEWPKLEIPETQATIEGEALREAAGRAERVWPAHSD